MSLVGLTLKEALHPLLMLDGLVALAVVTRDGLPVEVIGHDVQAEPLAAELAAAMNATVRSFAALGLGPIKRVVVELETVEVNLLELGPYLLAVLVERYTYSDRALIAQMLDKTSAQLKGALGVL